MTEETLETPAPSVRATIRGGQITFNGWSPALIRMGPSRPQLDRLADHGLVLADLTFITGDEGEEVLVNFVPFEAGTPQAEALIEEWAQLVGYRRLWFPGRVAQLEPEATLEPASVDCPTCGCAWTDSGPEFWSLVRSHGWFPSSCSVCGGSLPEWQVSKKPAGTANATRAAYGEPRAPVSNASGGGTGSPPP